MYCAGWCKIPHGGGGSCMLLPTLLVALCWFAVVALYVGLRGAVPVTMLLWWCCSSDNLAFHCPCGALSAGPMHE